MKKSELRRLRVDPEIMRKLATGLIWAIDDHRLSAELRAKATRSLRNVRAIQRRHGWR